jgi:hypothetical protein
MWGEFVMCSSMNAEKPNQCTYHSRSNLSGLGVQRWWAVPLSRLLLCFSIIPMYPCFTTCYDLRKELSSPQKYYLNLYALTLFCFSSWVTTWSTDFEWILPCWDLVSKSFGMIQKEVIPSLAKSQIVMCLCLWTCSIYSHLMFIHFGCGWTSRTLSISNWCHPYLLTMGS